MTDNFIRHQPDSTGKRVETEELVNYDGVTVNRQTTAVIGDVDVSGNPLELVLLELRVISYLLVMGLDLSIDVDNLRQRIFESQTSN